MLTILLFSLFLATASYMIGSVNGAIIISRLVYKDDVRLHGSKNAGLTNFLRTYGKKSAFFVLAIDILKTAVPVLLSGFFFAQFLDFASVEDRLLIGRALGGLFAMLGHCYPLFSSFKGGKAVLSGGTAVFCISLPIFAILLVVFLVAVILTRYISLGSVLAAFSFPISAFSFQMPLVVSIFALLYASLLIGKHHGNIGRLVKGTERKLSFKGSREEGSK